MARGALRAHLVRLGIASESLDAAQIEIVLDALEKGLRVFVGSPKAAALIEDVRAALRKEAR